MANTTTGGAGRDISHFTGDEATAFHAAQLMATVSGAKKKKKKCKKVKADPCKEVNITCKPTLLSCKPVADCAALDIDTPCSPMQCRPVQSVSIDF